MRPVARPLILLSACCLLGAALDPATALAQGRPPAAAAAPAEPSGPQPSKAFSKNLGKANDLLQKGANAEVLALLDKTDAMAGKTPPDQFFIDYFRAQALAKSGRLAEAAASYEKVLASGLVPAERLANELRLVSQVYGGVEPRNWAKAADYGMQYLAATGGTDREALDLVAIAHYQAGRADKCPQTIKYGEQALTAATAAQVKPQEGVYQVLLRCYAASNDAPNSIRVATELVRNYSKRAYWAALTDNLKNQATRSDTQVLSVYRLMFALNLLESSQEYFEMATLARDAGFPGEAEAVMRKGLGTDLFANAADKARGQQLLDDVSRVAAGDRKELPALEAEAKATKTGDRDVSLGEAFLTYGQADKAVEAIRRGLGKGVKNADEANLLLGKSLLKAGNAAEAATAFGKVTGPDLGRLAVLWSILATQGMPAA